MTRNGDGENVRGPEILDALGQLSESTDSSEYDRHIDAGLEDGNYDDAVLETPTGGRHDVGPIAVAPADRPGEVFIDVRERNVPSGIELVGCRLEARADNGSVPLAGELVDEGERTANENGITTRTVLLESD